MREVVGSSGEMTRRALTVMLVSVKALRPSAIVGEQEVRAWQHTGSDGALWCC